MITSRVKRVVYSLFLVVVGAAIGYSAGHERPAQDRGKPAAGRAPDYTSEISVRRGSAYSARFRPHAVQVEGRRAYLSNDLPDSDAPVTTFVLDGGRVQIACTEDTTPPSDH